MLYCKGTGTGDKPLVLGRGHLTCGREACKWSRHDLHPGVSRALFGPLGLLQRLHQEEAGHELVLQPLQGCADGAPRMRKDSRAVQHAQHELGRAGVAAAQLPELPRQRLQKRYDAMTSMLCATMRSFYRTRSKWLHTDLMKLPKQRVEFWRQSALGLDLEESGVFAVQQSISKPANDSA